MVTRDKVGNYIMIYQEDTEINIYASNTGATKYIKQIVTNLKGEIYSYTILGGSSIPYCQQWRGSPDTISTNECWN